MKPPPDCQSLVEQYLTWLRQRITVTEVNGVCEITTPFLDRHNDCLQLYVEPEGKGFSLTDDGYILGDLETSGCPLDTDHRKETLHGILLGFGVELVDGALVTKATRENFPQRKHALVQAMLAVNDMFVMSKKHTATLFVEDVAVWLDEHDVRYSENIEITGQSGFHHKFDFLIPKSRQAPERLVRAVNQPTKDASTNILFSWTDTQKVRPSNSRCVALLNDLEKDIPADVTTALEHYDVIAIPWSRRDQYLTTMLA